MVSSLRAHCVLSVARATRFDLLSNAKFFLFLLLIVVLAAGRGGGSSSNTQQIPNPRPAIASVSPSAASVGSSSQTMTISGSNFLTASTVNFGNTPHTPTFVNSSQVTIQLTPADQGTAVTYPLVASNPAPGGRQSNAAGLTVNNLQPVLKSISPFVLATGSPGTTITVSGESFVAKNSVIRKVTRP